MSTVKFKKNKNWKKYERAIRPSRIKKLVDQNMRLATMLNGKILEQRIRESITKGQYKKNAPLTIAIKGENKPLVGVEPGAQLFQAITSIEVKNDLVFVGVLRTDDVYNIAKTVHEGTKIKVTDKMRGMFAALARASKDKKFASKLFGRAKELYRYMKTGWKPLKKNTTAIIIPSRPFITRTMDKTPRKMLQRNWEKALQKAFKESIS